jgi:hypothetical protein
MSHFLAEIGRILSAAHQRVHDQQAPVDAERDGNGRRHAKSEARAQRHAKRSDHDHHRYVNYDLSQPATRAGFSRFFEGIGAVCCGMCHARAPAFK